MRNRVWVPLLLGLILFSSAGRAHSQNLPSVQISIDMWVGFGPWVLGKEKGFFEKRGVKLDPVIITGTGEKNAAMAAKRVQGRAEGLDSIVLAGNQGIPGVVVLAVDESMGGDGIVATREIRTIADLRGKKVGFQSGLPGHFFLLYLLHKAGMTEADISPQIMDSASAGSAFLAGKLDAAVTWEPWLSRAARRAGAHLLASTRENPGVIVDVLALQPEFVRDHPHEVEEILLGWFDAVEFWKKKPAEANAIMARFFKIPIGEFTDLLQGVRFSDQERNRQLIGTARNPGKLYEVGEAAGQIWREAGVLRDPPKPIQQLINVSVCERLVNQNQPISH